MTDLWPSGLEDTIRMVLSMEVVTIVANTGRPPLTRTPIACPPFQNRTPLLFTARADR